MIQSDAAATILGGGGGVIQFVQLLIESSYYLKAAFIPLESPLVSTLGWLRFVQMIQQAYGYGDNLHHWVDTLLFSS